MPVAADPVVAKDDAGYVDGGPVDTDAFSDASSAAVGSSACAGSLKPGSFKK